MEVTYIVNLLDANFRECTTSIKKDGGILDNKTLVSTLVSPSKLKDASSSSRQ